MGLTYRIDDDQRIIYTQIEGTVTDADLLDNIRTIWQIPDRLTFDEIVDVDGVDSIAFTGQGLQRAAELSVQYNPSGASYRIALVASSDALYGMGRMYEAYHERTPGTFRVFRTYAEALAWLRPAANGAQP